MTQKPDIAAKEPAFVDVEAGKSYWWCACGKSKKQPFCDGSHEGTGLTPLEYKAEKTGKCAFCQCKRTARQPMCDGSHSRL